MINVYNGTKGGDSGVTLLTAFAYGGGTPEDQPGGSGAGENVANQGAGTGLGASGEVTTGGHLVVKVRLYQVVCKPICRLVVVEVSLVQVEML